MKKILYILVICLGVWVSGCSENGDDGFYDNLYRVYFPLDSLHYAFGDKPVEMTRYTVKVPVQMLGEPAHTDMKVKVKVDLTATTAMDDAYTAIPSEITIPKDSIVGYVPVEIIRENFDLRPAGIIRMLDLRRPIYKQTAAYGHFGRTDLDLSWEKTDKAEALKKYL